MQQPAPVVSVTLTDWRTKSPLKVSVPIWLPPKTELIWLLVWH